MSEQLERKCVGAECDDKGHVTAVVATLGVVDRDREVILHDAVPNGARVKLSGYGHSAMFGAGVPVGKGTLRVESDKLVFHGRYFLSTQAGAEAFRTIKEMGPEQEWSFGFRILKSSEPDDAWRAKGAVRILEKLAAFEVSPVVIGAGLETRTIEAKCDGCGAGDCSCTSPASVRMAAVEEFRKFSHTIAQHALPVDVAQLERHIARFNAQYGEIGEVKVHPDKHRLALELAAWASARWRVIPPKSVKWFHKSAAPEPEWGGFYDERSPDTVWLRSDVDTRVLAGLVFHEVSHYARVIRGLPNNEAEVRADTAHLLSAWHREE